MRMTSQRTILGLSTCMALHMTSFVMIQPLFARRFSEIGAGVEALGISATAFALTSILAAPFMGTMADRFGRKPVVLVSLAINGAAFIGYLFASSTAAFIALRGLAGVAIAGLMPAVTGLAADQAPKDRQAQWIAFIIAGASVGWVAGPIAGGLLYDHWGYGESLIISTGMASIAFLVALLSVQESRLTSGQSSRRITGSRPKDRKSLRLDIRSTLPNSLAHFSALLFMLFAVAFAWAFIEPRFMFYAYNDLGWSSALLGFEMSVYGVAMVFGELVLGQLSDRLGRKPVILTGLALFSAQFIGLAFFRNYILLGVAFAIAGLGNALYDPALSALILDISPLEHRSRILGIKSMAGSSGATLGPTLLALLNSSMDARSIFLLAVGVVLLATLTGLSYPTREQFDKEEPGIEASTGKKASSPFLKLGEP